MIVIPWHIWSFNACRFQGAETILKNQKVLSSIKNSDPRKELEEKVFLRYSNLLQAHLFFSLHIYSKAASFFSAPNSLVLGAFWPSNFHAVSGREAPPVRSRGQLVCPWPLRLERRLYSWIRCGTFQLRALSNRCSFLSFLARLFSFPEGLPFLCLAGLY